MQAQRGEAATREGISRLSGGVDIKQGSMHARADNAEIQQAKDGGIAKVTLTGTPATLKQTLDDGRLMDAQARTVRYDVAAGIVVLEGGALVTRGADRMQGEQITYQPDNGMMNAEGTSDKPVIFTLQPTARAAATTPDSATPAPTPPPAPEKPADGER